jgi:predicted metal-dependent hydrolase
MYTIRRSERAKHLRIVVKAASIEVVAPPKVSDRKIKAFVELQQEWIKAASLRVADKIRAIPTLAPMTYAHGVTVPFQGRQIPLRVQNTAKATLKVDLQADSEFVIDLPMRINATESSELIRLALIRWMKNQARQQAGFYIDKHAQRHALVPRSLKIKTQKSRWGSCGPQNDINMNWLLMLAPPAVLEYVVVHELCHIKHKNHSREFWQLVTEHLPDYQQQRRWLKRHGNSLMLGL